MRVPILGTVVVFVVDEWRDQGIGHANKKARTVVRAGWKLYPTYIPSGLERCRL